MTAGVPKKLVLRPLAEKYVLGDALDYLAHVPGLHHWRANSGVFRVAGRFIRANEPGCADVIGCFQGRFFAVETKRVGQPLRPDQVAWKQKIEAAGGVYCRAECVSDVQKMLARIAAEVMPEAPNAT